MIISVPQTNSVGQFLMDSNGRVTFTQTTTIQEAHATRTDMLETDVAIGHSTISATDIRSALEKSDNAITLIEVNTLTDPVATLEPFDTEILINTDEFAFFNDDTPTITAVQPQATTEAFVLPFADTMAPVPDTGVEVGIEWDVAEETLGRQRITPENDILNENMDLRIKGITVLGSPKDDLLIGTDHDDILIAGRGIDVMNGGEGADVFVFAEMKTGNDRIVDFDTGDDVLYFAGETLFGLDAVDMHQDGSDTVLSWHRGYSELRLNDVDMIDLTADNFVFEYA